MSLDAYGDLIVMQVASFGVELSASTHLIARGAELSDDIYDTDIGVYSHTTIVDTNSCLLILLMALRNTGPFLSGNLVFAVLVQDISMG